MCSWHSGKEHVSDDCNDVIVLIGLRVHYQWVWGITLTDISRGLSLQFKLQCGPRKCVGIEGQLFVNIFNSIQCWTKCQEHAHGEGVAAFLDLTLDQRDMSTWLGNDVSNVTSIFVNTHQRCNFQQIFLVMSELVKQLHGTRLEIQSSIEKAVLDKHEWWTNIWKCVSKQQHSPKLFNCLLDDSMNNRVLVKEQKLSWPHGIYQFCVEWPASVRNFQIGYVWLSGNGSNPHQSLHKENNEMLLTWELFGGNHRSRSSLH